MKKYRSFFFLAALIFSLGLCSACTHVVKNNDRTIQELARHMIKNTNTRYCCDMEPGLVHAESGFSIWAGTHQVAFYKYNLERKKMVEKLEQIKKTNRVYILGYKYPALVHGSFIMIDYENTPMREELIKAFLSF